MENDRVLGDLWGKSNVPVVLNNPYSEAEQVRARGWGCLGWETQIPRVCGNGTHPGGLSQHKEPAGTMCIRSQELEGTDPSGARS